MPGDSDPGWLGSGSKDCQTAAEQFSGLIRDMVYLAILFGVREPLSPQEMDRRAEHAVDLFLNGIGACA